MNEEEQARWDAKTDFPIGVDLNQKPPEMRYQLLAGQVFTLQLFPSGAIARGVLAPIDLTFDLTPGDGWYDGDGRFLGDDPNLPQED